MVYARDYSKDNEEIPKFTFQRAPLRHALHEGRNSKMLDKIPTIGLGTATIKGSRCVHAVKFALDNGYRHLDTALCTLYFLSSFPRVQSPHTHTLSLSVPSSLTPLTYGSLVYGNQKEVGQGLRESGVPRDDVWLTSKVAFFPSGGDGLWMYSADNVKGDEAASIELSLKQLQVDFVDLMLIHNPCTTREEYNFATAPHFFELLGAADHPLAIKPESLPDGTPMREVVMMGLERIAAAKHDGDAKREMRAKSWQALELAHQAGQARFIGVSNYSAELLLEMKTYATILPAVNQVEFHPRFAPKSLLRVAAEMGVTLVGYGSG